MNTRRRALYSKPGGMKLIKEITINPPDYQIRLASVDVETGTFTTIDSVPDALNGTGARIAVKDASDITKLMCISGYSTPNLTKVDDHTFTVGSWNKSYNTNIDVTTFDVVRGGRYYNKKTADVHEIVTAGELSDGDYILELTNLSKFPTNTYGSDTVKIASTSNASYGGDLYCTKKEPIPGNYPLALDIQFNLKVQGGKYILPSISYYKCVYLATNPRQLIENYDVPLNNPTTQRSAIYLHLFSRTNETTCKLYKVY